MKKLPLVLEATRLQKTKLDSLDHLHKPMPLEVVDFVAVDHRRPFADIAVVAAVLLAGPGPASFPDIHPDSCDFLDSCLDFLDLLGCFDDVGTSFHQKVAMV